MPRPSLALPLALLALLAACTDPAKRAAEEAIQATEKTLAAARADAARWVPARLEPVDAGLARAREAYARGDFKGALAAARDLPAQAGQVAAEATARQEEVSREYAVAVAQLPLACDAIQRRLDELAAAKKLPQGVTPAVLAAAREELAALGQALKGAEATLAARDYTAAVAAARPLRGRALALAGRLGLEWGTPAGPAAGRPGAPAGVRPAHGP